MKWRYKNSDVVRVIEPLIGETKHYVIIEPCGGLKNVYRAYCLETGTLVLKELRCEAWQTVRKVA